MCLCLSPSLLLLLGGADCLSSAEKRLPKGIGRKEPTTPAVLPDVFLGDCSTWLLCGKVLHQRRRASTHFGFVLEKKPIFLLGNVFSEDQTLDLNILREGRGGLQQFSGSGYLLGLDINLIVGTSWDLVDNLALSFFQEN